MGVLVCKESRFARAVPSAKSERQPPRESNAESCELGIEEGERKQGARRRRRHVRKSFCGSGVCASGWQTIETFTALLSVDELLGLLLSSRQSAPRSRSRCAAPCCLSIRSALKILGFVRGFALSVYSGLRVYLCDRKVSTDETPGMFCTLRLPLASLP
eukprot:6207203-Pleurochrysis_carterae.AAC.3